MRNNETGEFELVVGNRQLLSAFFIVVLLFAVSFAMGYVVGQNTQKSLKATVDAPSSSLTAANADRPQPLAPAQASTPTAGTTGEHPTADPNAPPQPTTQPAQSATPSAVEQQPVGTAPAAAAGAASDLPPGSYWQVMALNQSGAEAMRQTLKDKGFPVMLTPGRNSLTRVLVGPYTDTTTLGRAKADLENNGIHPVIFKREQ
jgi:cell division septation protein DedD